MAKVLFLAHRIPFPPNKGDKIRAFHILRHLAEQHDVWLGAAADELADLEHVEALQACCVDVCAAPLGRTRRLVSMAAALATGRPLSVARFRHPRLGRWITTVLRDVQPDLVFLSSSALGQYVVRRLGANMRLVVDFMDADAQKWRAYAEASSGPMRWIYSREARLLARFEQALVAQAASALVVSETERRLMADQVKEASAKVCVIANGVDTDYFAPSPQPDGSHDVVLCGRMDYLPNIEGAQWFAHEVLPKVRRVCPQARFRIVGAAPAPAVLDLQTLAGVEVVGAVPDVRPYLVEAAVVVAPLRIARGIQNKVLEGMAAGRPVIATPQALDGICAEVGREVLTADDADSFAYAVCAVLQKRGPHALGRRAREFVVDQHRWSAQLRALDAVIAAHL